MGEKLEQARQWIEKAIEQHKPAHIFGLYSGGHDSGSVTHFAAAVLGDRMAGVVHINTGIGIEQTRQHVRKVCDIYGWDLLEYKATENTRADGTPDPIIYEDLVKRHGFPGAFGHGMMYNRLKERQIRRLCRDYGATPKAPIMLISGCRKEESTRRMGTTKPIDPQGRIVWVAPFADMTALDCREYMTMHGVPKNPVKDLIHMSGECLCGAFAHKGELAEIEAWFPDTAREIRRIEREVAKAGFPWGWEDKPPAWWTDRKQARAAGQGDAFEQEWDHEVGSLTEYLCTACHKRAEAGG